MQMWWRWRHRIWRMRAGDCLGMTGKMFVLRPDGYLGFRARMGYQAELMNYARQDALT